MSDSLFFVKIFIRFGVDLQIKDCNGKSPIDITAKNNSVKTLTFLNQMSTTPI